MASWAELVCSPACQRAEAMASHAFDADTNRCLGTPGSFLCGLSSGADNVRNTRNANNARNSRTRNRRSRSSHTHTGGNMRTANAEVVCLRVCPSVAARGQHNSSFMASRGPSLGSEGNRGGPRTLSTGSRAAYAVALQKAAPSVGKHALVEVPLMGLGRPVRSLAPGSSAD